MPERGRRRAVEAAALSRASRDHADRFPGRRLSPHRALRAARASAVHVLPRHDRRGNSPRRGASAAEVLRGPDEDHRPEPRDPGAYADARTDRVLRMQRDHRRRARVSRPFAEPSRDPSGWAAGRDARGNARLSAARACKVFDIAEVTMAIARRKFLKTMAAFGVVGLPGFERAYDPNAKFEITVSEVDFQRNKAGRMLMARIYRPNGPGPFPTVLDLHGGAWNAKDRRAEEPMDRALASSGVLVVAIDLTLAPDAPYPASVQDANYGVRWLKHNAPSWNGDPSRIGVYGSSSGGHVAELLGLRPRDPRYNAIPLSEAPNVDATVAYVAMRSPVSDPFARFKNAEQRHREPMMNNHKVFFVPWETIHESNPQEILERREPVTLVPLLIMQGALDDNVLPTVQEKFARTYTAAGGDVQFQVFEDCEHEWVAKPGPQTDRAREMVKAFIARQLRK